MSVPLDGPVLALRAAIHDALAIDAALTTLLGGPRIHDVPPADAVFPFVALGEAAIAVWSTATDTGTEHALTLHAFSRSGGRAEAFAIAAAIGEALHDAQLLLVGHRLVNLRATTSEVRREADGRTFHALVRFRAVTEPL